METNIPNKNNKKILFDQFLTNKHFLSKKSAYLNVSFLSSEVHFFSIESPGRGSPHVGAN